MRVLIIENSIHKTGAFVSALDLAHQLGDGHEVEFLVPANSVLAGDVAAAGYHCHRLPMREIRRSFASIAAYLPMLLLNTVRLRLLLLRGGFDALVVNDYYNLLGFMARLTGWDGRLVTFVRLLPANQHRLLNRVWTWCALRKSHRVHAVSRAVAAQMPDSDKVEVHYNVIVPAERLPPAPLDPEPELVRCLCLANYIAGKGHDECLAAFALAHAENPALRLRFVGSDMGLAKNRMLRDRLEAEIVRLGLADVVVTDSFSADIELAIKQADILLNFSHSESFSRTCFEGGCFGRPVIATRCGGPEEIIEDGSTGLLVDIGDVAAMAKAIVRLSRDGGLRCAMGADAARRVRERFVPARSAEIL